MLSPAETAMRSTLTSVLAPMCQILARGVRCLDHDKLTVPHLASIVGKLRVLRLSSSLYGCATRTVGLKACCLCGTPTFSYLNGKSKMLGRMVRFASNTPSEAAHTDMAALTMRVQRTHHRELENARRTRLDIVAKDSSKRLAK